jgi:hypothetical protein
MFKSLVDFSGYEALGIITTVFFFLLFVGIIVRVMFLKKKYVKEMEHLPLEPDDGNAIEDKEQ